MENPQRRKPKDTRTACITFLKERGVSLREIAALILDLQISYLPNLTLKECTENLERVLDKREVQNAILTGLSLDVLTEKGCVSEPLKTIIQSDDTLYGIDEILSLSIVNVYGSIGFTNFGYLDKLKPGIIGQLNSNPNRVNTFLDDLIAALAAATAARIAHRRENI